MQLFIKHRLDKPLILPINYHHILQGIIYHALEQQSEYSKFVHDNGYVNEKRKYKLFTYGLLRGRYIIKNKQIIFTEEVSFEIRCIEPGMLRLIKSYIMQNGVSYGDQHYSDVDVCIFDREITSENISIRMVSPICVYSTMSGTKATKYYNPTEEEFCKYVNDNFKRKYEAYTGIAVDSDIRLEVKKVSSKDKYVTRYKNYYITAWRGQYILSGKRQYLDFLYQTGLGSKNSQGFGMFEVVAE